MVDAAAALAAMHAAAAASKKTAAAAAVPGALAAQVFRTAGRRWGELLVGEPRQQARLLRALVELAPLVSEGTVARFARGALLEAEGGGGDEGEGEGEGGRLRRRRLRSALAAMWAACRRSRSNKADARMVVRTDDGRVPLGAAAAAAEALAVASPSAAKAASARSLAAAV